MKKIKRLVLVALVALTTISVHAQDFPEIEEALTNKDMATVIIYRTPQLFGAAANWAIFEGGERLCKLSNKKYMIYQREPGDSDFRAQVGGVQTWPKKVTGLEIPLEAGKVYYIKTNVKTSFTRARVELTEVTDRAAQKEMAELSLDRCSQ